MVFSQETYPSAIAQYGSFTRAAEELFLTQPTVSQQMKQLTKAIGVPLYEQIGKRIYLYGRSQNIQTQLYFIEQECDAITKKF